MCFDEFDESNLPKFKMCDIDQNEKKLRLPYTTPHISSHFIFSFGKMLKDCAHPKKYASIPEHEETVLSYSCWKQGYVFYAPQK